MVYKQHNFFLRNPAFFLFSFSFGITAHCQTDPLEYVENICEYMHIFQKEDLLIGDQLLTEYNPQVSDLSLHFVE